jgi:hypothetical protein
MHVASTKPRPTPLTTIDDSREKTRRLNALIESRLCGFLVFGTKLEPGIYIGQVSPLLASLWWSFRLFAQGIQYSAFRAHRYGHVSSASTDTLSVLISFDGSIPREAKLVLQVAISDRFKSLVCH